MRVFTVLEHSQSAGELKPNSKLILLCLKFNKSNKQNVCYINSPFLSLKITVDTDWCQEWNIKSSLKISYNKCVILLSDVNVPVHFRAKYWYSSLQLTAKHTQTHRNIEFDSTKLQALFYIRRHTTSCPYWVCCSVQLLHVWFARVFPGLKFKMVDKCNCKDVYKDEQRWT